MKIKKNKIKFRRNWGDINPITRIKDSDKRYNRARNKRELNQDLEDAKND